LSFEIYHPKNNVHNQDGNHDDNKVRITIFFFFFELTDNDGQNFLSAIVPKQESKKTVIVKALKWNIKEVAQNICHRL
jgi:hypothetical protein